MIKLGDILNEAFPLPPEIEKEADQLSKYLAALTLGKRVKSARFIKEPTINRFKNARLQGVKIHSKSGILPTVYFYVRSSLDYRSNTGEVSEKDDNVYIVTSKKHFVRDFGRSLAELTDTVKHEMRHKLQDQRSEHGLMIGLPKTKVLDKKRGIHGIEGQFGFHTLQKPHHLRDIEFKTNVHTYAFYIKRHLDTVPEEERINEFKRILLGNNPTGDKALDGILSNIGNMLSEDPTRGRLFIKELYKLIFL